MLAVLVAVAVLAAGRPSLNAQVMGGDSLWAAPADSTMRKADTASVTTQGARLHAPASWLGRPDMLRLEAWRSIDKREAFHVQYRSLGELLVRTAHAQPRSQGGLGQPDGISLLGGRPTDLVVGLQGRSYTDPWTKTLFLEQTSVEHLESATLFTGADAIGLAPEPTLTWLSLHEASFDHATPYTRLWYSQGGGDFIAADVIMSQNVAPNVNVTAGVRRAGAIGGYDRTVFDVWNVRLGVRAAFSEGLHMHVGYHLTSMTAEYWGGIDQVASNGALDEASAVPVFRSLADDIRRHDLTATIGQRLADDSTSIVSLTLWGAVNDVLRRRDSIDVPAGRPFDDVVTRSALGGLVLRYDQALPWSTLRIGVAATEVAADATPYAGAVGGDPTVGAFGHVEIPFTHGLSFRGAGRLDLVEGRLLDGLGAAIVWSDSTSPWMLRGDISTLRPAVAAVDGGTQATTPERQLLAQVTANHRTDWGTVRLTVFQRTTVDALEHQAQYDRSGRPLSTVVVRRAAATVTGATIGGRIRVGHWVIDPVLRADYRTASGLPSRFDITGECSVAYRYVVGRNWAEIGMRGAVLAPTTLEAFLPQVWRFVDGRYQRPWVTNGLDAFLVANVGDASVRLSYENIAGQAFSTVGLSPSLSGNFRLSVTWAFFD